jgi:nicotinamide-nucleotide amidase
VSESLEQEVVRLLTERGLTLAVAESCTGGLIGHRITNVPGSSACFRGGVIAYHNDVKAALLNAPADILAREGAVSEGVAVIMARAVRERLAADIGLAVTGIAGPAGGTPEKPVGLVYIALAGAGVAIAERHVWSGDRRQNKESSAEAALKLVKEHLLSSSPTDP